MARPVIALLTDFGLRDHYVGVMKGVVLGICPEASLVDISHDVAPQDILAAALELDASYRFFPAGTIFLVVVDPGVGSSRRAIAVAAGGYRFVGPDNGVLSVALQRLSDTHAVELTNPRYALSAVSRTFEGRDRFAPAAAWLASGVELAQLGVPARNLIRLDVPAAQREPQGAHGTVVRVDRFGNLITNIDAALVAELGAVTVEVAGRTLAQARVVATYAEAGSEELCALVGSSGHLEIAVNGGNAAAVLGAGRGTAVVLRRSAYF